MDAPRRSRWRAPLARALLVAGLAPACADDGEVTGPGSGAATLSGGTTTSGGLLTTTAGASESEGTDTGHVAACGDGVLDRGEECDEGALNGSNAECKPDCTLNVCGDGEVGPREACDAGEYNSDEGECTSACEVAACGDGLVKKGGDGAEECDAGPMNGADQLCTAACKLNVCGDGGQGPGEACDDGNVLGGDGCSPTCESEACGNGMIDDGELCDDGKDGDNDDGCTDLCTTPICGDGFAQASEGEGCDDGNADNGDACSNLCHATPKGLSLTGLTATTLYGNLGGGTLYEDGCPQGEAVVGFAGWIHTFANWHGKIQVLCGSPGLVAGDQFTVAVGGGAALPMRGVIGDFEWSRTCPKDQVVIGFEGRAQGLLDKLIVRCAPLLVSEGADGFSLITGAETSLPPIGGESGNAIPLTKCGAGEVATMGRIRAGDFIDAFGLGCSKIALTY